MVAGQGYRSAEVSLGKITLGLGLGNGMEGGKPHRHQLSLKGGAWESSTVMYSFKSPKHRAHLEEPVDDSGASFLNLFEVSNL